MATIKYELGKPKQDGSRKVSILLSHRGERKRIPTTMFVTPDEITVSRRTKEVRIKSPRKLHAIEDIMKTYNDRLFEIGLDITGKEVTVEYIADRITAKRQNELDFFSFADSWLAKTDIKGKPNYITMLNSLERFIGQRRLPFSGITYKFLSAYSESLKDKERAQSMYLGAVRHIFSLARLTYNTDEETIIVNNPFERFKVPRQKPKGGRAMDVATLVKVFSWEGTLSRAILARDCAMLSFFLMGTNSSDLYNAREYKNGVLSYDRTKTKARRADSAHIEIMVPDEVKPLFKKYRGASHVFNFSQRYSSPHDFQRALNIGLKEICADIGIAPLQFYQFRHSWATIARNDIGIDKGTVNDALNHIDNDMRVTDIYIKKDFKQINLANRRVADYIMERMGKRKKGQPKARTAM